MSTWEDVWADVPAMSDEQLLTLEWAHGDDSGFCAAGCNAYGVVAWHPCTVRRAVVEELRRREFRVPVSA